MSKRQHMKMRGMKRREWPKAWLRRKKSDLRRSNMKRRQLTFDFYGDGG